MMKKLQKSKAVLALVLALFVPSFMGCQSPEQGAYQATGVVVHTVHGTMQGWGDYVQSGKASDEDRRKVKAAYEHYQSVMRTQRALVIASANAPEGESVFLTALNAADAAKNELISLIQSLRK